MRMIRRTCVRTSKENLSKKTKMRLKEKKFQKWLEKKSFLKKKLEKCFIKSFFTAWENLAGDCRDVSRSWERMTGDRYFGWQLSQAKHFALSKEPIESVNGAIHLWQFTTLPGSNFSRVAQSIETFTRIFIALILIKKITCAFISFSFFLGSL